MYDPFCCITTKWIKQRMLRIYYFLIKRKKLLGQPNILQFNISNTSRTHLAISINKANG